MHARSAAVAAAICVTLAGCTSVTVTQPPGGAASPSNRDFSAATSNPVEDSYYPDYGEAYLDTLHYGLRLEWQPTSSTLTGTATIDLRVTTARDSIQLNLGDPLKVTSATLDGKPVSTTRGTNTVIASTPGLAAGSSHQLVISYAGTPATVPAPSTRGDETEGLGFDHDTDNGRAWTWQEPYGAFTWYPVNDQPSDKAYYDATLVAHGGLKGVFNGMVTSESTSGDTSTTSFHLDAPAASYLTTVAFGRYKHDTATGDNNLPLNYWYDPDDPSTPTATSELRKTPQILRWLTKHLGPYPFASAGVVMVPGDSAMETQTLVTFGANGLNGNSNMEGTLAHEYAHQWVGDETTPADWRDVWLSESLAMYIQTVYEDEAGITPYADAIANYKRYDQSLRTVDGPPGNYNKGHFASSNVYTCGALMLDAMHTAYGSKFDDALREWPRQHRFGNATRDDFISFFGKRIGVDLRGFVTTWLTSATTPTITPPQA